jgi:hypothetical protein
MEEITVLVIRKVTPECPIAGNCKSSAVYREGDKKTKGQAKEKRGKEYERRTSEKK